MKKIIFTLFCCSAVLANAFAQSTATDLITDDISNFWKAYDKITSTKDSTAQYRYLHQLFLDKGTPGLKAIMQARDYTDKSYIEAINKYPMFWNSIRPNTLKARSFADSIAINIQKLKTLYPSLKPAKIYFTIGAFKTGGTTLEDKVLIGSEIALADEHTVTSEFPASFNGLKTYFKSNPIKGVVFTNVHEYVHTQQKTTIGNSLLAQCLLEGVAEFMAEKATGLQSSIPALKYGRENAEKVKQAFSEQLFNTSNGFWLYSNAENQFGLRDLGYYIGYAICEKYYQRPKNKKQAIKEMIELDYNNQALLMQFVNQSGYFEEPVEMLKADYEKSRPTVLNIRPFANLSANVDTLHTVITIEFSTAMDKRFRNFELGPLGKDNLLKVKTFKGFSTDGRSMDLEVELKPGTRYQLLIGDGFRNQEGVQLKPYLIDFTTAAK